MGKVTIIVESDEISTTELERVCHSSMAELRLHIASVAENGSDPDIFIVPSDDE